MSLPSDPATWSRDHFVISTDRSLLSLDAINNAFAQDFCYWSQPFPKDILQKIIDRSFCFGLYDTSLPHHKQIGFARLITDDVTFAYLTDLYVLPDYQGRGLGGWLIDAIDELLCPLPHLRWTMLRTASSKSKVSYQKKMDMHVLAPDPSGAGPVVMGRKGKGSMV
ncbi:uncharacterized protein BDW47DRAFT_110502 [Aspergillus candidus]|uniref:N-acetyltransferase domain-containing protein n=1 Tax=Aspergillus candidus TaxID=41067 RepID=A0A2I2F422_ASPCN|nr:hypothetical protein BDW47DRAFT_110502 [Aspergillus candidus]PLB35392.1 hypothetical protein BDW47DRAFT_110502 [Aspergillus candidus]